MPDPIYLGRADGFDRGWIYYKKFKLYDVSEGLPEDSAYEFQTTHDEPDTSVLVDIGKLTALVVVDMQNFFLHPRCNDYPEGLAAAERTLEVIAKCRKLGIKVRRFSSFSALISRTLRPSVSSEHVPY